MILRRAKTGEDLLAAGGVWDSWKQQFIDEPPRFAKIIEIEESQVPVVEYFAAAMARLRNGQDIGDALLAAVGDRRAGKTFISVLLVICFLIDLPKLGGSPSLAWIVNKTYQDRDEIEKQIEECVPGDWYIAKRAPEYRYFFVNGGVLRNLSAKDPDSLRRGRADVILYNEAQKMALDALANGIYGTADRGGLSILAANPPKKKIGEWVYHLKEAYEEERIGGVQFFMMHARDNRTVSKPQRDRVGAIMKLLDPKRAAVDEEGLFLPVGDRAYEKFNGKRNLRPAPIHGADDPAAAPPDITGEIVRRKLFGKWEYFGGADFQGQPWNAAVVLQALGDPKRPEYQVIAEFLKEGWEDDLIDEIVFDGRFQPENLLWIGDASGTWQDAHHSRGRVSFDVFKARRWRMVPPQLKKSDRGEHPRNPDVLDRLNLVNRLLAGDAVGPRLFVDPARCPRLAEALRECEFRADKPRGKHAHITDALGYALWWIEPKPRPAARPPSRDGFMTIPRGSRTTKIF